MPVIEPRSGNYASSSELSGGGNTCQLTPNGIVGCGGCLLQYLGDELEIPERGHVLAPWVCVEMEKSNSVITVSNDSSPNTTSKNSAVIKSMDFGHSDGFTAKIVIHDQGGSEFVVFMANLLKDMKCANDSSLAMTLQFGWTKSGCSAPVPGAASPKYYMYIDSIEANFSQGKFQYEITGKDLLVKSLEVAGEHTEGGDGEEVSLKDAIRKLLTDRDRPPTINSVKFLKKINASESTEVGFKDGENGDGLKSKWSSNGQSKLEAVRAWTEQHLTENEKAWRILYNPEVEGGEVIFWEDPGANCSQFVGWDNHRIGSYIVNGGRLSPVIDFNPNIRWDLSRMHLTGGTLNDEGVDPNGAKSSGIPDCPSLSRSSNPPSGQSTTIPSDTANDDFYGETSKNETSKSQAVNSQSLSLYPDEINADLVIVGNPGMARPALAPFALNVSIAFVNPYHITGNENKDWMAQPPCNSVLSNRGWVVTSVRHNIEAGSYRTTLGVKLFVPGVQLSKDGNLGADAIGWKPPANCPSKA